jgi:uroporphyrin-III C-methyltransferase
MNKVYLVGAGPGDPELLTLKALRLLERADVVLHDALVSREILDLVNPDAQVVDIGKRCGNKLLTQQAINDLLISFASTAHNVVRLKGGDPSIFGRAGEEIEALSNAGVPFEIVPGITSALAGAAAAGISLTDRRYASSVVFTTAHRGSDSDSTAWTKLVTSDSTIVIYMPGQEYENLADQLKAAGLGDDTPCAIVSCVGRVEERVEWSTVGQLASVNPLPAPSLLILGECARRGDSTHCMAAAGLGTLYIE